MSSRRSRHVAIGQAIAEFLLTDFQKIELLDHSQLVRTRADLHKIRAEAQVMAQKFKHGLYSFRKDKMKFVDGPPYDAATKTEMYDHDDGN